ncbi:MAG: protocatechuate 3,4-dioxygenase subunit alpha [Microbacteriaceae bacterium]
MSAQKNELVPTAGQTVGPFFHYGMPYELGEQVSPLHNPHTIVLSGYVTDGAGNPIPDCQLEIWQPNHEGSIPQIRGSLHRDQEHFTGFGRTATDDDGLYRFFTQNPGAVADTTGNSAPFISVIVFARGLLNKLHTRIYLPEDELALAADDLLKTLTVEERASLIAQRTPEGNLRHDIRLQGEQETIFLEFKDQS